MTANALKAAALVFVAALVQVTLLSPLDILGGTPDLVLVTLVAVALLRGSIYGAAAGFGAGLVLDVANLATLGQTSFLLTLAGYWIGRYGETTGRDRAHAPLLSVVVVTVLYAVGAFGLHAVLGDAVSARHALLGVLPATIVLNAVLTVPVYALCRRLLRPLELPERARGARLLA